MSLPFRPRLSRALSRAWARVDDAVAGRRSGLSPAEFSCRAGCFGCCLGLFAVPLPEALAARAAWRRLSGPAREETLARARRAAARSAPLFPGDPHAGLLDPERTDAADERYFESVSSVACPFLDLPAGACRVYPARPVTCRTFGLALRDGAALAEPACPLNFAGAALSRSLEAAIDASGLLAVDQAVAEAAAADGLPAGAETTLAHVLAGTLFARS
ncbi:MAG TPA: YkgJ family cysteine cluster protein [Thermoanaerobaculia bacterium]|nr:YkgJ family cysteine cluster protein [Thermoanaerobaculia bacterium]